MKINVKHNVIRSADGRIKFKKFSATGREHYHIGIWLDGDERELDQIDYVEYKLHPTFTNRMRTSRNRKNNFSITFWTWGMFDIDVMLHMHSGETETFVYPLSYQLPADDGKTYIEIK